MKVDFMERKIIVTNAAAKKASQYGSKEYYELLAVTRELPNFEVIVKSAPAKRSPFNNITYAFMEEYITAHDVDGSARAEFEYLRHAGWNYAQVKKWFLHKFSNVSPDTTPAA